MISLSHVLHLVELGEIRLAKGKVMVQGGLYPGGALCILGFLRSLLYMEVPVVGGL